MKQTLVVLSILLLALIASTGIAQPQDCESINLPSLNEYRDPVGKQKIDELNQKYEEPCILRRSPKVNECLQTITLGSSRDIALLCWYAEKKREQPRSSFVSTVDLNVHIYDAETAVRQIKAASMDTISGNIPDYVKKIFGTNVIQAYIHSDRDTEYLWIRTNEGRIEQVGRGRTLYPKPTLKLETTKVVVSRILSAKDNVAALQDALKNGEIKIQEEKVISVKGLATRAAVAGIKTGLISTATPTVIQSPQIFDTSGKQTSCNIRWELLKTPIGCNGVFQDFGFGKNCCELDCGASSQCDELAPGEVSGGRCDSQCKFTTVKPVTFPPVKIVTTPAPSPGGLGGPTIKVPGFSRPASNIGVFPGFKVCEFSQKSKKLVSCGIPNAGAIFCSMAFTSPFAVNFECDDQGDVICGIPCQGTRGGQYMVDPKFCAFDINRERGTNAEPLDFC